MSDDKQERNIWDDEDELRRMILEAETAEIWQLEEADDEDEDAHDAAAGMTALRMLQLRSRMDSGADPKA